MVGFCRRVRNACVVIFLCSTTSFCHEIATTLAAKKSVLLFWIFWRNKALKHKTEKSYKLEIETDSRITEIPEEVFEMVNLTHLTIIETNISELSKGSKSSELSTYLII